MIVRFSCGFVDAAKWAMTFLGVFYELILGREGSCAASDAAEMIFERSVVFAIVPDQVFVQYCVISEYRLALQALEESSRVTTLDVTLQTTIGGEE